MEVVSNNYMPGDPRLIDHIVYELKSQGIFDNFRKECIADVDTKPAYQNLRQRVEGSVSGFLKTQKWRPDMNKNQVREMLRKNISESGFLETGVERIVDQVVNPKINSIFLPQVENVVYKYLGIQKPSAFDDLKKQVDMNIKPLDSSERLDLSNNLLPSDLETVSPESETQDKKLDISNESQKLEDRMDEDESPPFEPLEESTSFVVHEENSIDSHLSGFSGLASHDSNHSLGMSNKIIPMEISNQDSQLSKQSSDDHLSIVMSDDVETKIEINEDSTHSKISTKMNEDSTHSKASIKITDTNSKNFDFMQDTQSAAEKNSQTVKMDKTDKVDDSKKIEDKAKSDDKKSDSKSDKHRTSSHKHKSRQDSRDHKNEKDRKSDKDKKDREKSGHSSKDRKDKDKERKDKDSKSKDGENKSDRDRSKSSSSKHSSSRDKSSSKKDSSENKTKETSETKDLKSSEHKDAKLKEDSKLKVSKEKSENSKSKSESKSHNSSKSKGDSKSYSKHNGKSKPDLSDSSRSSSKSSNKKDEKSHRKEEKHQSRSDKHSSSSRKDDKYEKEKREGKKDPKKETKDDHYSLKGKKSNRRSTDRDSSDGHSGTHSSSSSFADLSVSSQLQKSSQDSSVANSGSSSGDSGNSEQVESTTEKSQEAQPTPAPTIQQLPQVKLIKPKFASNIFEARRLMKIRKKLGKLEKRTQMELMNSGVALNNSLAPKVDKNESNHVLTYEIITVPDEPEHNENLKRKPNILKKQPNILKASKLNSHSKLDTKVATPHIPKDKAKPTHSKVHEHKKDEIPKHSARKHLESKVDDEEEENIAEVVEISDDSNTTPLFNSVISKESWDAIEAKLNSENALKVDYNAYTDLSEDIKEPEEKVVLPVQAENIPSKAEDENCLGFDNKLCIEAQKRVDMMYMSINWLEEDVADRSKIHLSKMDRHEKQADVNNTDGLGRRLPKVAIVDVTADSEIIISPRKGIKRHAEDHPDVHNNNKTNKLEIDIVDERLNHVADKVNQPMKTTAPKVKRAKIVDSSVNQLENFNLPLSPADSDKSFTTTGDKKNGKVEAKNKRTISNRALKSNQRYSSDDLYKPRLQFSSTRRRATRNNSNIN